MLPWAVCTSSEVETGESNLTLGTRQLIGGAQFDLGAINLCHMLCGVAKRAAAECAEDDVSDAVPTKGIEQRFDTRRALGSIEQPPIPQVARGSAQLEIREYLVVGKPSIAQVVLRSILASTKTEARLLRIDIGGTVDGFEHASHVRQVLVARCIELIGGHGQMAIGPTEHVLLLCDNSLEICAPWHVGIGHVEHGEALAVLLCEA